VKWKTFAIAWALVLAIFLFAQHHGSPAVQAVYSSVIDLTHTVNPHAPTFEGAERSPYKARTVETYAKDGFFARHISLPEHFGTHLDAPAHFSPGRWTVDEIPAERLVRPLVVLNVSGKVRQSGPDYVVSLNDVADYEKAYGRIPPGAVVMAYTGWDLHWGSQQRYRNADANGVMHFPGFSLEAAQFLVEGRTAVGLGIDTLSVDAGAASDYPVHRYCAEQSVYHVESVANLEITPPAGAMAFVAPAKLQGGSGGPVRVLALIPPEPQAQAALK
jgi:kynurenine formamidase